MTKLDELEIVLKKAQEDYKNCENVIKKLTFANKILKKAFESTCVEIRRYTCSCPKKFYDYEFEECQTCHERKTECWAMYFIEEAQK